MSAILKDEAMRLRPMREADVSAVMEIERRAYAFPWTGGIFRDCLRVGYCCWILEQEGAIQ
ncbi:MAG: ribosomal-protein-alanine N-acetyltransferase, partial [Gammaproteobacteria bacterium]